MINIQRLFVLIMVCSAIILLASCIRETEGFSFSSNEFAVLNEIEDSVPEQKRNVSISCDESFLTEINAEKDTINDMKDNNVSPSLLFDAFESVSQNEVLYIENGPLNWVETDLGMGKVSVAEIVPLESMYLNMPRIFSEAEALLPGKVLKYHIWFDNECAYGYVYDGLSRVDSISKDEFNELRDTNLVKLCNYLQVDVEYEQTITGEKRVKSPDIYVTRAELEEICHSGISYLFYSLTPPDLHRLAENHPNCLESAKDYLYHNFSNYYWTYYHRTGEVVFNEDLFQHVRAIPNNWEEYDNLYIRYNRMGEFLTIGMEMKYGESICTVGTPEGEKWTREFYNMQLVKFGDLVDKYIVDGEFLKENLETDREAIHVRMQEIYDYASDGTAFWKSSKK